MDKCFCLYPVACIFYEYKCQMLENSVTTPATWKWHVSTHPLFLYELGLAHVRRVPSTSTTGSSHKCPARLSTKKNLLLSSKMQSAKIKNDTSKFVITRERTKPNCEAIAMFIEEKYVGSKVAILTFISISTSTMAAITVKMA